MSEGDLERAKEKAPQPEPSPRTTDAAFVKEREQERILNRLDTLETHFATKADLHTTHVTILAATIGALLVFLSISAGTNVALFRMLVGTILDAFTGAIHQPLRPPPSTLPLELVSPPLSPEGPGAVTSGRRD